MTSAEYVARLVAAAPAPTAEQLTVVRGLLGPGLMNRTARRWS